MRRALAFRGLVDEVDCREQDDGVCGAAAVPLVDFIGQHAEQIPYPRLEIQLVTRPGIQRFSHGYSQAPEKYPDAKPIVRSAGRGDSGHMNTAKNGESISLPDAYGAGFYRGMTEVPLRKFRTSGDDAEDRRRLFFSFQAGPLALPQPLGIFEKRVRTTPVDVRKIAKRFDREANQFSRARLGFDVSRRVEAVTKGLG